MEPDPKLGFAEVAAIGGIAQVPGVFELMGLDLEDRNVELVGEPDGCTRLDLGIGGAPSDYGEKPLLAQRLARGHGKDPGVHATGVSQDDPTHCCKMSA
jgi:hypothetical protein